MSVLLAWLFCMAFLGTWIKGACFCINGSIVTHCVASGVRGFWFAWLLGKVFCYSLHAFGVGGL
jgi:hypothetical protein